jgi:hypothetical protein
VPPPLTTSTCRPCRSSTCASFRHPYPLPYLRGEAKTAQIANTIAISRALALLSTSFLCSPLPDAADVKRPDMPPATRAAARVFASTSQAEEHPPRSAATSDRLLLPPSSTPPRAGHSSPPPASPPRAPPWPGAPQRPCKLWPRPLLLPLTGEPPPPDRAAMGSATPVSPSPPRHIKSGPHLVIVFPDPLAHRLSPPAVGIDEAAAARAPWLPCSRQWAASPWAAGQPIGPGQIRPRSTVAFAISYLI